MASALKLLRSLLSLAALLACQINSVSAQALPPSPISAAGRSVTAVFEGWYKNPDGTFSLSFGYFNRNAEEHIEIPRGPNNFITPAALDALQPTRFAARRHWGVFAVVVPPNFGAARVVWTLIHRGDTVAIPGSLKPAWEIDALAGEAGTGNTPPFVSFTADGPSGAGPLGIRTALTATLAKPLTLTLWVSDDGRARNSIASDGRHGVRPSLTWFLHHAPDGAQVQFANASPGVGSDGKALTTATFSETGEYVLRARVNDASGVASAGHAQCCWTNAFAVVTVTK